MNSNTTKCYNKRLLSSSPSSNLIIPTQAPSTTTKTMEEVWKEINLSQDSLSTDIHHHSHSDFRGGGAGVSSVILQDFLARPFNKDPPTTSADTRLFGVRTVPSPPILSLNSGHRLHLETPSILNDSSFNVPLDAIAPSSALLASFGKKRLPESDENIGDDRRHKRMIKNRESASRSRARKQAYTNELEVEVAHLMKENARLKRQQEQLCMAAASAQLSKKHTLHRTSTAPF